MTGNLSLSSKRCMYGIADNISIVIKFIDVAPADVLLV